MLDTLTQALTDKLGPLGPLYALGGLGVLLVLCTLPAMLHKKPDPLNKLKQEARRRPGEPVPEATPASLRHQSKAEKLKKYAAFLEPQNEEELTSAKLKMLRAGYRSKEAVRIFHFAQFALGIGALVLGLAYALLKRAGGDVSTQQLVLFTILPAAVGYYLPRYWIEKRVGERQKQIQNGFPDALDMLLVCVEAGQSLDQGIVRVARELKAGFPALAEELEIVAYEVKAGKDKPAVLRSFAERANVAEVHSFVTVLIQSQTFGTSIVDALRVYAADMRDKRVMRAEELANKLPTKMTLGTMLFTVPPLLLILVGPSVYGIVDMLGKMGQ